MDDRDRLARMQRIRYVTRNFGSFQGYRALPWIPALLLWAGSEAGVLRGDWWLWAFLAAVGVAIVGWVIVNRWYRRTYGIVQQTWDARRLAVDLGWVLLLILLLVVGFMIGNAGWHWPDQVIGWEGIAIGVVVAVAGWPTRRVVPLHLWSGVAVVVLSALPLGAAGGFGGVHPFATAGGYPLLLAAIVAVQGVASHVALDRMLGSGPAVPSAS